MPAWLGMEKIRVGRSPKFLTLVCQIGDDGMRLRRVRKGRTEQSVEMLPTLIGERLTGKIELVCSDASSRPGSANVAAETGRGAARLGLA